MSRASRVITMLAGLQWLPSFVLLCGIVIVLRDRGVVGVVLSKLTPDDLEAILVNGDQTKFCSVPEDIACESCSMSQKKNVKNVAYHP